MKILHAIPSLDPADGGPPQVAVKIAEAQARLGHEVVLLHLKPSESRREAVSGLVASPPGERRSRIETVPKPRGLIERFRAWKGRIASEHPDIVHIHGVWRPESIAAAGECRRHGIAYVVETFGSFNPWAIAQKRLKKTLSLALFHRRMLRRACFLHALNAEERDHMTAAGLGAPIEIYPNGVFLEEFDRTPIESVRSSVPGLGDAPFVLFLARLHPVKGLDLLATAFAEVARRLPTVHLVVAGPRDVGAEDFEAAIAASRVSSQVHLVGEVGGDRKLALLREAICFTQPSRSEGFSVSILEALASGRPAVITVNCNFPEVEKAQAGRVVPFDGHSLAEALVEIAGDAEKASRLGANARRLVEREYTWEAVALRSVEAYRRGLEGSPSPEAR